MKIIYDMSFERYLMHPALSSHQAMEYMSCPARYLYNLQNPKPATPAMIIGRAVHTGFLEPELFDSQFVVAPDIDRRSNGNKKIWEEFEASLKPGQQALKSKDMELVRKMVTALNNSKAKQDIEGCKKEVSIFFEYLGVDCKARLDALDLVGNIFYDLKTAESPDPEDFKRDFFRYRYPFQMAYYMLATGTCPRCIIHVVGKTEPIGVTRFEVSDEVVRFGLGQVIKAVEGHKECITKQIWPNYNSEILNQINLC